MKRKNIITPLRSDPSVSLIQLSTGGEALINTADVEKVRKYRWHQCKMNDYLTYARAYSHMDDNGKQINVYLHRLIMDIQDVSEPIVDHRNGNGLDNRKSNLYLCNKSQNFISWSIRNKISINTKAISGYKGYNYYVTRVGHKILGTWYREDYANQASLFLRQQLRGVLPFEETISEEQFRHFLLYQGGIKWRNIIKTTKSGTYCVKFSRNQIGTWDFKPDAELVESFLFSSFTDAYKPELLHVIEAIGRARNPSLFWQKYQDMMDKRLKASEDWRAYLVKRGFNEFSA